MTTEKPEAGQPRSDEDRPNPGRIMTKSDFGRELTLAKERAGVTVRQIAKVADVPTSTIGGYLTGRHLPALQPPQQLRAILSRCNIVDPEEVERWYAALRRARRLRTGRPPVTPAAVWPRAGVRAPAEAWQVWGLLQALADQGLIQLSA